MNILTFIPVYRRREITELCYQGLERIFTTAPHGIHFQCIILASTLPDAQLAHKYGFTVLMVDNNPVGAKLNKGLEHALANFEFDYLFQLNSDNILHLDFWAYFDNYFKLNEPFFGCNHIAFYDSVSHRLLQYLYMGGCGIRFIRKDILQGAAVQHYIYNSTPRAGINFTMPAGEQWIPASRRKLDIEVLGGTKIELWPTEKNSGLDDASSQAISRAWGNRAIQKFPFQKTPEPLVIDIKSETNIHPFDEFLNEPKQLCRELIGEDKARVLRCFPELQQLSYA